MTAPHGLRLLMSVDAVGGVWTYALDLAAGLAEHGVATGLAVLGPPPDAAQCKAVADITGLKVMVLDQPLEWLASSASEIRPCLTRISPIKPYTSAEANNFSASCSFSIAASGWFAHMCA